MNVIVNKETPFVVPAERFCIGQTSSGYTLQYSADGVNYTSWDEPCDANKDVIVTNAVPGIYMKLSGNVDDKVTVTYGI